MRLQIKLRGDRLLQTTIANYSNSVNRLYTKGGRTILIEIGGDASTNPPPLNADFPNDSVLQYKDGQYIARFHAAFYDAMNAYRQARPDLRILSFENAPKVDDALVHPAQYDFTVVTIDALDDPALMDKSFTGPGADYVFWDPYHGTSKLHELITGWHLEALTNSILEQLEARIVGGLPSIQMNHLQIGRDYTLQISSDLSHWQDARTFTATVGTNQWTAASSGATATFYRLKWQQ